MTETIFDPLTSTADPTVRAQDDLYRHINGGWLNTTQIPADQGTYGSFIQLRDESIEAVHAIAQEAVEALEKKTATPVQERIGKLFASFMAEEDINVSGGAPIIPLLLAIERAKDLSSFMGILGGLQRAGVPSMFVAGSMQDAGNTSRNLLHIIQGGIGLPDESFYREEQYEPLRQGYKELLAKLFELAELKDSTADVYQIEEALASHHWDRVKVRDANARYNLLTKEEVLAKLPVIEHWLDAIGVTQKTGTAMDAELVLWQPDYVEALDELLNTKFELTQWKAWAKANVLRAFAPYLSEEFVTANFEFYGKQLSGTQEQRERYKRGVELINGALGEDVAQLYVAAHFPESHKAAMDELVEMLIEAYRQSITSLPWMGEQTRQRALEKLDTFRPMVGYPTKWIDYSSIDLSKSGLIPNVIESNEFEWDRDLKKIIDGPDPEEWHMSPQTVNAYYAPLENAIVFPAAILQQPFFHPDRDAAYNYGAIGAVIGHEIGHGFDDQGSKYDGAGELRDWWTDEDRAAFKERTDVLVKQFAQLEPVETPGSFVNGELTLGENIGDLGGLGIAHKAFRLHQEKVGQEPTAEEDQKFFAAWAQCWRQLTRPETMKTRLATDPHSPNEFRCNQIVKNLEAFHTAYGTAPGDGLWLDEADRVTIW